MEKIKDDELIEKDYFIDQHFRKVKKTIVDIAKARILELAELICIRNINLQSKNVRKILLEINDLRHLNSFQNIYSSYFSHGNKFEVEILHNNKYEELLQLLIKLFILVGKRQFHLPKKMVLLFQGFFGLFFPNFCYF